MKDEPLQSLIISLERGSACEPPPCDRRQHKRVEDCQLIAIANQRTRLVCDLIDVSPKGARIRIVEGAVPFEGEPLALLLFDGTPIAAHVVWVGQKSVGIEFVKPIEKLDEHLQVENLGRNYFKKAVLLQKALERR